MRPAPDQGIEGILVGQSSGERLNRDCQHVTDYYRNLEQEIEATIQWKGPTGEDLDREQARCRVTEVEPPKTHMRGGVACPVTDAVLNGLVNNGAAAH